MLAWVLVCIPVIAILLASRPAFPGRIVRGSWWRALLTLVVGMASVIALGTLLVCPRTAPTVTNGLSATVCAGWLGAP